MTVLLEMYWRIQATILLNYHIGQDYWNFVCNDSEGFKIVFNQYKISAEYIRTALTKIKDLYF